MLQVKFPLFRRTVVAIAAVVIMLLILSGCAGRDDAESTATLEAAGPPATATPRVVETPDPTETVEPDGTAAAETPSPGATPTTAGATATPTTEITSTTEPFDPSTLTLMLELVAEGFDEPLFVTNAGDGSGRVFVVEKGGTIRLLDGTLFLDIRDRVGSSGSEQGLLGLAFHPDLDTTPRIYVNYTDLDGNTIISSFDLSDDRSEADPESERVLIAQEQPAGNHNGGMLAFGPDGYLYIGFGDGGGSYDRFDTAQNMTTLLGKMLRIDVDGGDPYGIPPDNPFVDGERPEIWALGVRNPWRFTFDRATGDLYIADVGQNTTEWVHFQPADSSGGENYGWPIYEGTICLLQEQCDDPDLVHPIAEYGRDGGCAIIGGYVYRGDAHPELQGAYLFGDLCSGFIWTLARDASGAWQTSQVAESGARISSFGEDEVGEIYVTDINSGRVLLVVPQPLGD